MLIQIGGHSLFLKGGELLKGHGSLGRRGDRGGGGVIRGVHQIGILEKIADQSLPGRLQIFEIGEKTPPVQVGEFIYCVGIGRVAGDGQGVVPGDILLAAEFHQLQNGTVFILIGL